MAARDPETGQFIESGEARDMNVTMLMSPNKWSPTDGNNGPDTPLFTVTQGQLGNNSNVSGNCPKLGGGDLPDNHLAKIHALEFMLGDITDDNVDPGEYVELWVYFGHNNADPFFQGRWVEKLPVDDFMAHFRAGYGGIEDTASGTGGSAYQGADGPGALFWRPPSPMVSATGEISVNWEGDTNNVANGNGEFALRAWWTTEEVSDTEFFRELLRDR